MPEPSPFFQWLDGISLLALLAWAAGIVAIVAFFNRHVMPVLRAIDEFFEDWRGTPDRPGVKGRPGVMATLNEHGEKIQQIEKQVTPNHSSTDKLADEVQAIRRQMAEALEEFRDFMTESRTDHDHLWRAVSAHSPNPPESRDPIGGTDD